MPSCANDATVAGVDLGHRASVTDITQASESHRKVLRDGDLAHCFAWHTALGFASLVGHSQHGRVGNSLDEGQENSTPGESRGRKAAGPKRAPVGVRRYASRAAE